METKMKASVLAKKLRNRLIMLREERAIALKKHDRDFTRWQLDVARFMKTKGASNVHGITKSHADRHDVRYALLNGMPEAPNLPDAKEIREVQKTLRYLAFTGITIVQVTRSQIENWFGEDGEP